MQPYDTYPMFDPQVVGPMIAVLLLIVILEMVLKSIALWRAARMNMVGWFIALLFINTAGIFPLLFILLTRAQYEVFDALPPAKTVVRKKRTTKA